MEKIAISEKLVPANYLKLAQNALKEKEVACKELLEKRKLPQRGWSDAHIEELVHQLSALDSNNFPKKAGVGEREARIYCSLVARRHYQFGHGIGRSGDLLEPQPKAAGSTLLANLTNALLLDLIQKMGVVSCTACFLTPMATGMTLMLCLLALRRQRPQTVYVLWSRIDQKACFKSIISAGLTPIIIDPHLTEQQCLSTDINKFKETIEEIGADKILCLYSTTSCFAPRNCDNIIELAQLAAEYQLPHLVNNAYGLQSTYLTHQLEQAQRVGRIDLVVQSTDKNLMVPVGGAIVAGFDKQLVHSVAKTYAGRASSSQSLDVFMTLLSMGSDGYMQVVKDRKENFRYLREKLYEFARTHKETVLEAKSNPISLALTLTQFSDTTDLTKFGSMLYTRGVSGARVLNVGDCKQIESYLFYNWGTHHNLSRTPYLTVAAALGLTISEIDIFFKKLEACWYIFLKSKHKSETQE